MKVLLKTKKEMEYVVSSILKEKFGESDISIDARPQGYLGLVLVDNFPEEKIKDLYSIPEIEKIVPIYGECRAELEEIKKCAEEVVKKVGKFESFLVRTTRRGLKHDFTSIDCDRVVGARIKDLTNADVDIVSPEVVFMIEIINDVC